VVNREQQTGSTQDRTALGVQVSPRRPSRTGVIGVMEYWINGKHSSHRPLINPSLHQSISCCARSLKRAGGLIPRIALDQCRDPERCGV